MPVRDECTPCNVEDLLLVVVVAGLLATAGWLNLFKTRSTGDI